MRMADCANGAGIIPISSIKSVLSTKATPVCLPPAPVSSLTHSSPRCLSYRNDLEGQVITGICLRGKEGCVHIRNRSRQVPAGTCHHTQVPCVTGPNLWNFLAGSSSIHSFIHQGLIANLGMKEVKRYSLCLLEAHNLPTDMGLHMINSDIK